MPFVAEGDPRSVVDLNISATVLGPTSKLLILSALTREMAAASASNAEVIIGDALALSAEQSLDAALFSNAAATTSTPAGILHHVVRVYPGGADGARERREVGRHRGGAAPGRPGDRRQAEEDHHDPGARDQNPRPREPEIHQRGSELVIARRRNRHRDRDRRTSDRL